MSKFETDEQNAFKTYVKVLTILLDYVEYGDTFLKFKDPASGKYFEVRLKEIKPKEKKS